MANHNAQNKRIYEARTEQGPTRFSENRRIQLVQNTRQNKTTFRNEK